MAIKTIVDNLESVPEGMRELYSESGDRFVLNVDGIDEHPDVANLRSAYTRVKDSEKQARADLQELKKTTTSLPDDFDPELWKQAQSGELTEGLVKVRKELEGQVAKLTEENGNLKTSLHGNTIDSALSNALEGANITNPAYKRASVALLKNAVKLEGDKVFVDSDMGPLDVNDYVKKWAGSDEGKSFVSQPKGGGSRPGDPTVTGKPKTLADCKTLSEKTEFHRSKLNPT